MTTPNIVPRGNGEGGIGTNEKFWKNGYFENLQTRGGAVATESHVQLSIKNHNSATSVHTANLASKAEAEAGTDTSKFMTPARVSDAIKTFAGADLTGMIFAFAGNSIPSGFLLCDGSQVSRTTYKKLFDVIGKTYGEGDGSTTFTLPNLIDRFLEGGSSAGQYRDAGLPNIEGKAMIRTGGDRGGETIAEGQNGALKGVVMESGNSVWRSGLNLVGNSLNIPLDSLYLDASKSNVIYGKSNTVQPSALTMRYIIKY